MVLLAGLEGRVVGRDAGFCSGCVVVGVVGLLLPRFGVLRLGCVLVEELWALHGGGAAESCLPRLGHGGGWLCGACWGGGVGAAAGAGAGGGLEGAMTGPTLDPDLQGCEDWAGAV